MSRARISIDEGMPYCTEFFDLQYSFAERIHHVFGTSLEDALFEYTNLYVRFGLGRDFDAGNEKWRAYLSGLRASAEGRDFTYRFYVKDAERATAPNNVAVFGCFSYALAGPAQARLHFRNAEANDRSPLDAGRVSRRKAELAELTEHVIATLGEGALVIGCSWLYNLDAYNRLFPPAYLATAQAAPPRLQSMSLWGQFVDHRGRIKHALAEALLASVAECPSLSALGGCFPCRPLAVQASALELREFYRIARAEELATRDGT